MNEIIIPKLRRIGDYYARSNMITKPAGKLAFQLFIKGCLTKLNIFNLVVLIISGVSIPFISSALYCFVSFILLTPYHLYKSYKRECYQHLYYKFGTYETNLMEKYIKNNTQCIT